MTLISEIQKNSDDIPILEILPDSGARIVSDITCRITFDVTFIDE